MQQTPIQELIEDIKANIHGCAVNLNEEGLSVKERSHYNGAIIAGKDALRKAIELLPTEQQYLQQHAEGFLEWFIKSDCEGFDGTYWIGSTLTPISELYTKYIEYINSLTT